VAARSTPTGTDMAMLTIRVDDSTRDDLEALAATYGTNLSAMLREQIDALLGRGVQMKREDVPRALTMTERLILARLHEVLVRLDDEDPEYHQQMVEVLTEGFAGEYDRVFGGIDPELSRSDCALVWDILDMFRILGASLNALDAGQRANLGADMEDRLRFMGFDLSDSLEGRLLYYVRHLVATDRWSEIRPRLKEIGDDGNAHHPCLPSYRRMLDAYEPILSARRADGGYGLDAYHFGVPELRAVAEAWAYPH
jgi:uncharacterized protein